MSAARISPAGLIRRQTLAALSMPTEVSPELPE